MDIEIKDDKKSHIFINIIQSLKVFTDSLNIYFQKDKFYIQGMDSSHVSMFDINITNDWFDKYEVENDICIGVNINILSKILSTRNDKQDIHLNYSLDNTDKLNVDFLSDESSYNKYFVVPLVDIDSELLSVNDMDSSIILKMDSRKFKQLIDQIHSFSDVVKFKSIEDNLFIETDSDETLMKIELTDKNSDIESLTIKNNLTCSFNTKFIHNMCMFFKISETVEVKLDDGIPLQIIYKINENSSVKIFLAPKMGDDDM
jgi:proliferating cell nuclear antigen PCNA